MKISETLKTAIGALNSNKVRAALTMLGVIIGVFAVIVLIALGRGIQNYITDQFNALGSNLVFVAPGKGNFSGDPALRFSRNKLEEKHVNILETYTGDYIEYITPNVTTGQTATYKTKSFFSAVYGSNEHTLELFNFQLEKGRFYSKAEVNSKARVAIIGPLVVERLFGSKDPIDSKIKIGDDFYTVIGVFLSKGTNFDDEILIPYTSAMNSFGVKNLTRIAIKIKDPNDADIAIAQFTKALKRDLKDDDFTVLSQKDVLSSIQSILKILTMGIGAIAGISLIVGGIGIMNIMLVSVTERIKEIGLRKALGATSFNIGLQFLLESTLLSIGGGVIGIIFGWLGSLAGRAFVRTEVPWWSVLLAFGFASGVGIIFGTYPALKASKKDPIEALRYE